MNYFKKVGAHHVDCDGDDGGDVSDGGDVEDSHDLPCNLSKSAKEMAQILPWSPP